MIGQQKIDQLIPNAEKRKVEQAQRHFNQFEIFDGEKILRELIRQHPNEPYYHEALVRLQRQVLRKINYANIELENINESSDHIDSNDNEVKVDKSKVAKRDSLTRRKLLDIQGLDRDINSQQEDKIKRKKKINEEEEVQPTEAIVTIDSSLLTMNDEPISDEESKEPNTISNKPNKELANKLKTLSEISAIPYDSYKDDLIRNARQATRLVEFADSSSAYLREFMVDTMKYSNEYTEEAMIELEKAHEAYHDDNYVVASKSFKSFLKLYPNDLNAILRLGDAYAMMGKDTQAANQYLLAYSKNQKLSMALEKLALLNYHQGKFLDAASYIIEAISIYPQQHYFTLLKRIVSKSGKSYESQWIQRPVFPATTAKNYEEIIVDDKSPWWHYQFAKQEVFSYFDTCGIMRPNEKTRERYLEIYTWKKMLNNSSPKLFPFARAMNQMGYLDCYVLISLFHQDLYSQFQDFAKRNPDKIKEYFYILVNWDDKKFDKVKKQVAVPETIKSKSKQ